ncbi:hypothetical protein Aperf_G00000087056 [Anoplocephala perfoliata]
MATELETNVVSVERVHEYSELSIEIALLMLLIVLFWKFANITNDTNFYAWNYLYPGTLCTLMVFQLLIVNLESVRDRTSSAVYFLGCLFLFIVTLVSVWNTASYRLRSSEPNQAVPEFGVSSSYSSAMDRKLASGTNAVNRQKKLIGQLGFVNTTFPPNWNLSISPHELSEYLLCICAFFNFLLAFFSDRYVPPVSMLPLTPPIRPEDQTSDSDLVATDDKPSIVTAKLDDGTTDKTPEPSCIDPTDLEVTVMFANSKILLAEAQTLCPEKYVSYPSRVTFFWVTKLIILGYRNTLQLGHLWTLESKNLSVNVVPPFLRNVSKYLHVNVSDEVDVPHTSASKISINWPAQDSSTSTSEDGNSGVAVPNPNAISTVNNIDDEQNTFAKFSAFGKNIDATVEGATGPNGKADVRQRITSAVPHTGKKSDPSGPTLLPNVPIRISGRSSKSKTLPFSKKGSSVGDIETGLLGSDLLKTNKTDSSGSGKARVSVKQGSRKARCGLIKALARTYGFRMFIGGVFKFGHDVCLLTGPILFRYLLQFMSPDSKEPMWHGYSYAVAMFIIAFVQSILLHQYFRAQSVIGMDMRTVIISAVYRKSLRLSAASRGKSTSGEITNLMSIDSQRFIMVMLNIHVLWSGPFQVATAIYLLWQQLGPAVFAGVFVLLVMIPINTLVARMAKVLQEKQLKTTDKRIKLISEILNGIRILKLYAWEPSFIEEVGSIRGKELRYTRKFLYLNCGNTFVFSCAPTLAPWDIPEKQPPPQWPEGGIEFINYSTRYREDLDLVLHSISVSIRPGEKIGIVGRTGSGKSSLVLALFRMIEASGGEIRVDGINIAEIGLHDLRGRITLIPQDPVLFSGTLRFNLDPFNSHTDEAIWEALAIANLRLFVEGASSEGLNMSITEGGGNLSQGQRQLVCLARALLRHSRILVLDEATAAVDPLTDRFIQQAVRKEFASSTVLTIAHRLNTILDYDRIMVLDAGRLAEIGTPKELAKRTDSMFHGMLKEAKLLESDQLGFINVTFPPNWNLSISPHELSECLLCICAFFNLLLAFFSDRYVPPAPMLLLTPLIRPEDQPIDFDLVATDNKPSVAIVKIEDGRSGKKSKEPDPLFKEDHLFDAYFRGRTFKSRSDLVVHLLAFHRPGRLRGHCGLCEFAFKETPSGLPKIPPPPNNAGAQVLAVYAPTPLGSKVWRAELAERLKMKVGEERRRNTGLPGMPIYIVSSTAEPSNERDVLMLHHVPSYFESGLKGSRVRRLQILCPEKYVSYPSRVTFFWVTKLIIFGYRNTLQLGHLWALEPKHLAATVVPRFLRNISKHLHVDISDELDVPYTPASKFPMNWPPQDSPSSTSERQKFSDPKTNSISAINNIANVRKARQITFTELSAFGKNIDATGEGATAVNGKADKKQRILSAASDLSKNYPSLGSTTLLPKVQIRNFKRASKSKTMSSSKKDSGTGDVETELLGSDLMKANKTDAWVPGKGEAGVKQESRQVKCGLVKALFRTYGFRLFIAGLFELGHDICILSGPVLFKYLLQSMSPDSKEPMWHGCSYALLMFIIPFIQTILLHQYFRAQNLIGMDMRTAIISAVYRKSLRLSAASRSQSTSGEIINLMSIDSQRFQMLMLHIHMLWSAPFQFGMSTYLLWQQLGPSVLAGILVLLVMIPINIFIARKSKVLQEKQLKTTDKRIKLISEILNGIRQYVTCQCSSGNAVEASHIFSPRIDRHEGRRSDASLVEDLSHRSIPEKQTRNCGKVVVSLVKPNEPPLWPASLIFNPAQ